MRGKDIIRAEGALERTVNYVVVDDRNRKKKKKYIRKRELST